MAWQRVRIPIPEGYSFAEREAIAKELLEVIRKRSESGYGVKETTPGKFTKYRFPGYSKTYVESLDFKIAGKSNSRVDLTLSGDMLIAMDVLSTSTDSVLIGFQNGTEENSRAEGNQKGSYGGVPNSRKARSFLGVTDEELASVLSKFGAPNQGGGE